MLPLIKNNHQLIIRSNKNQKILLNTTESGTPGMIREIRVRLTLNIQGHEVK